MSEPAEPTEPPRITWPEGLPPGSYRAPEGLPPGNYRADPYPVGLGPHDPEPGYTGRTCEYLYADADDAGASCGRAATDPIHHPQTLVWLYHGREIPGQWAAVVEVDGIPGVDYGTVEEINEDQLAAQGFGEPYEPGDQPGLAGIVDEVSVDGRPEPTRERIRREYEAEQAELNGDRVPGPPLWLTHVTAGGTQVGDRLELDPDVAQEIRTQTHWPQCNDLCVPADANGENGSHFLLSRPVPDDRTAALWALVHVWEHQAFAGRYARRLRALLESFSQEPQ